MINIEKFQSEIQKNMQAMVNEYKQITRENRELQVQIEQLKQKVSTENIMKTDKQAVVIFAADNSGSMASWEKRMGRDYTKKLFTVLRERYKFVSTKYIHHHTDAELVSGDEFLVNGQTGGTIVSSAFRLINKELEDFDYENDNLDVFVVYISDGDNLTSDNSRVVKTIEKITKKVTSVIYVEVNQYNRQSTLLEGRNGLENVTDENFEFGIVRDAEDVDVLIRAFTILHLN